MRQIPFIHSVRYLVLIIFCIYRKVYQLFLPCGRYKYFSVRCVFDNNACALAESVTSVFMGIIQVIFLFVSGYMRVSFDIKYMAFAEQTKSAVVFCCLTEFLFCLLFVYFNVDCICKEVEDRMKNIVEILLC